MARDTRDRPRRAQRGETRLGNGRMQQQRSSGGEKSLEGLLLLPGLRCRARHDTPTITKPSDRSPSERSQLTIPLEDLETTVGGCWRPPRC